MAENKIAKKSPPHIGRPKGVDKTPASLPKTVIADDPEDRKGRLKSLGGSQSDHWNNALANQVLQALWVKNSSTEEQRDTQMSATVAALMGIAPNDELEGMMAAQLIAAHNASMECYRRAMLPDQTFEGRAENLNQANKLSRTYTTLIDALNKHRGKGQQKVTVEHVHIHSGGQAVVGVVQQGPGGLGGVSKIEDQPNGKVTDASQPALLGADAVGFVVPIGGNAERTLSHARRTINGRAEGE